MVTPGGRRVPMAAAATAAGKSAGSCSGSSKSLVVTGWDVVSGGTRSHAHPACSIDIDRFQTALGVRRRVMTFLRWNRLPALGAGLMLLACGGGGGDGQSWYVNNPLPTPLSVIVRDANNCPVPAVGVDWSVVTGEGGLSPTHS